VLVPLRSDPRMIRRYPGRLNFLRDRAKLIFAPQRPVSEIGKDRAGSLSNFGNGATTNSIESSAPPILVPDFSETADR
jgi:hypothetical protein